MRNLILAALLLALISSPHFLDARPRVCKPSGRVKGKKPPPDHCNIEEDCCIHGKYYTTYKCSPPVSASIEKGGDGFKQSKCDNKYHKDDTPVVSLPPGWYSGGRRCLNNITISGNGRSVDAMVIDECDSCMGCDADHDYQRPCDNNVVGASRAVWKALGVPLPDWGEMDITWSDAK